MLVKDGTRVSHFYQNCKHYKKRGKYDENQRRNDNVKTAFEPSTQRFLFYLQLIWTLTSCMTFTCRNRLACLRVRTRDFGPA